MPNVVTPVAKNYRCLMVRTPEKRRYFTYEKNLAPLLEYSRMFQAEISVVRVKEAEVLELDQLVAALCDSHYQNPVITYRVLGVKSKHRTPRVFSRQNASLVRDYIKETLLKGKDVSLRSLVGKYAELGLSDTSLSNQFKRVRDELGLLGHRLVRDHGGSYRVAR